ncbi:thiamine-phosphate kinase [Paeniglutamicibacter gangotriensis]|uniref:Thiamine-monophosphate kinase n=1 Tax=Paeniglutamicibacter gangotriensis TaxID=254787 RepID=A0A5B0E8I3_9MICC|nr:thiamine-phosphate kinase [Paeniglutamicibacter gangotriensis]KAA0975314.1 thiamine-phosphate kinase [Paeniglutamicibacter gangotriensis]
MPVSSSLTVGSLGESGLLARILPRLKGAAALLGPGDDAALIAAPDGKFVITVDTLVENQDFRLHWPSGFESSGFDVGWKSAAQNLSDINAMGAYASSAVISLTLPHETPVSWVEDLAEGFSAAVRDLGASYCALAGGDLGRGSELSITAAVTGTLATERPVLRSGAKAGDLVAVNGVLGVAAAGLALLEETRSHREWSEAERVLVFGQRCPSPPLTAGPEAARAGASAMMDLSDGLLKDGLRMASASRVYLDFGSSALAEDARLLSHAAARLQKDPMDWVLGGGEDHGLLATFPPSAMLPEGFRRVGVVKDIAGEHSNPGVFLDGRAPGAYQGFDHFDG